MEGVELVRVISPVVLFVAITGAIVRTTSLRGDLVQKWRDRVRLAEAGLSEHAATELRALQQSIHDLLGTGVSFIPAHVVADPGELLSSVKRIQQLIDARDGIQGSYNKLLSIPSVFFWGLVVADSGVALFLVGFGGFWSHTLLELTGWIGCVLFLVATFILALALWRYRKHQERLTHSDILSSPRGSNA